MIIYVIYAFVNWLSFYAYFWYFDTKNYRIKKQNVHFFFVTFKIFFP